MADNSKPEGVCPLSLLVFAANAHSQTEREEGNNAATSAAAAAAAAARLGGSQRSATKEPHKAAYNAEQLAQLELQEALQREALQRDALQQDALQQEALQRHALLSRLGLGNSGLGPQEQEYLQQLRLEALVQQRRQETLARLALTQEAGMSQEVQAIFQAQVLRQAAQLRQELLHGRGGAGLLEQLGALGGGRAGGTEENPLVQYIEEKARQERLAALPGGPVVSGVLGIGGDANFGADAVGSFCVQPAAEEQKQKEAAQDNLKTSVLPCRARGMPMDHNVKVSFIFLPAKFVLL